MIAVIGFLGAATVGAGLYMMVMGFAKPKPKLSYLADAAMPGDMRAKSLERPLPVRLTGPVFARLTALGRRISPGARTDALKRRLDAAGKILPVETFYAVKAVLVAVGMLFALLVLFLSDPTFGLRSFLFPAVGGLVGYLAPEVWVANAKQKRQAEISKELPEALDLLALTVQAGLGLEQGLAEVAGEVTGPLGVEFERLLKEQQLGRSRRDALQSLEDRNTSEDLRKLTGALLHSEKLGTPIATTLQVQARELRRSRRARARERAGKAPVKLLFPMLLGIFPALFVIIMGPGALRIIASF